jgi:hypothetical protein
MSLNRCEQRLFDYLQKHQEERQFWQGKFHRSMKDHADERIAVEMLQPELWRYYLERSEVVPIFKEAVAHEGRQRTSMKNLAELLLRLWVAPRPKPKKPAGE